MELAIEATGITKTYGKGESSFQALRGVDLAVKRGESVAIVGKSGSGKSTLMHLMALMDSPTTGSLKILGKDSTAFSKKELDKIRNQTFGFVFQQFFLNSRQSVLENVELPLKIAGVNRTVRREKALAALEAVGLTDKAENRANDLSGGQKQRVCIARSLVNDCSILFADEPSGALDSVTGAQIENILFTLNRDKGLTLVVITHDLDLAQKCDRQIQISDGVIQ